MIRGEGARAETTLDVLPCWTRSGVVLAHLLLEAPRLLYIVFGETPLSGESLRPRRELERDRVLRDWLRSARRLDHRAQALHAARESRGPYFVATGNCNL